MRCRDWSGDGSRLLSLRFRPPFLRRVNFRKRWRAEDMAGILQHERSPVRRKFGPVNRFFHWKAHAQQFLAQCRDDRVAR